MSEANNSVERVVMPDSVDLDVIQKYIWRCGNPHCRRINEESYVTQSRVLCEFCGSIFKVKA